MKNINHVYESVHGTSMKKSFIRFSFCAIKSKKGKYFIPYEMLTASSHMPFTTDKALLLCFNDTRKS